MELTPSSRVVRIIQVLIATGISVGLGLFVWHRVDSAKLAQMLKGIPPTILVASLITYLGYQMLRAWRFRIIFPGISGSFTSLTTTTLIQGAVGVILPLWLGELAIVALLRHRHAVRVGRGAAGMLLARGADFILNAALFLLAIALYRDLIPNEFIRYGAWLLAFLLLPLGLVISLMAWRNRLAKNVRGWASEHLALAATTITEMLRHHVFLPFLAATVLMWSAMFLFFHLVLLGLVVGTGPATTLFVYSMLVPISSIPLKGFADIGTHEAAWYLLLRMLGFGTDAAATAAFGSHAVFLLAVLVTLAIGLVGLLLNNSAKGSISKP